MPSPDKLFRLDPVETKIAAPVSQFQSLADAGDMSVANRSLGRGLTAFSQALGGLAQYKKQQQIRDDIKTAKDAAVRGEVMPDVLPVAETAYRNIIDINTSAEALASIGRFENGEDYDTLINDTSKESSQKTTEFEAAYDDFYARAVQTMQNPETIQTLRLNINKLKEAAYQKVYEAEKTQKIIQGVHGIANITKDNVRFAESTGVPLTDIFTKDWVNNVVKDFGVSHPFIREDERKLMVFQSLTANTDLINDPMVIEALMSQEFSKGFTYENLYFGKGEDAKEFKKIYDQYQLNVKANFKAIKDNQVAADKERIKQATQLASDQFFAQPDMDIGTLSPELLAAGMTATQIKTYSAGLTDYRERVIKEQKGSDTYRQVRDLVLAGVITNDVELADYVFAGNLAKDTVTSLGKYLTEEGNQRKDNVKTYIDSTATIRKTLVGLIKTNLKSKNDLNTILLEGGTPSIETLTRMLAGTNINPTELRVALNDVNDLIVDMQSTAEANGFADAAAEGDGSVPPSNLKAFQKDVQDKVKELAALVNGVLTESSEVTPPTSTLKTPTMDVDIPEAKLDNPFEAFKFNSDRLKDMKIDAEQRVQIQESIEGKSTSFFDTITALFTKSKPKETAEGIKQDLVVNVPLVPSEQKFLEQLKSGKNPSVEYKQTMKEVQQVPTRQELLAENTEAAAILERQAATRETVQPKPTKPIVKKPEETGLVQSYNELQDSISQSFSDLMDIVWGTTQSTQKEAVEVEGAKSLSDLTQDNQSDIKRQQEGKLTSAAPELIKDVGSVAIRESIKVLEPLIGKSSEENSLIMEETSGIKYPKVYNDSLGIPTIGIGFNLTKPGAKKTIEDLGHDYNKVLSGQEELTDTEINTLFVEDVATSIKDAKSIFNKGTYDFNSLPNNVASVVTKMVFQLGITRFKGFTQFIKAVKAGKYDQASKEILTTTKKDGTVVKSSFNKQVPARAKRLAAQIKGN
jgi:GH24 family phage-related lysozyme (muramidase)